MLFEVGDRVCDAFSIQVQSVAATAQPQPIAQPLTLIANALFVPSIVLACMVGLSLMFRVRELPIISILWGWRLWAREWSGWLWG